MGAQDDSTIRGLYIWNHANTDWVIYSNNNQANNSKTPSGITFMTVTHLQVTL